VNDNSSRADGPSQRSVKRVRKDAGLEGTPGDTPPSLVTRADISEWRAGETSDIVTERDARRDLADHLVDGVIDLGRHYHDANSERYWKRCDFVDLYNLSRMSDGRASR